MDITFTEAQVFTFVTVFYHKIFRETTFEIIAPLFNHPYLIELSPPFGAKKD